MPQASALMNVMIAAARKAARPMSRDFGEVENLQVSRKGPSDFVTSADIKAEKTLFEELSKGRPGYGFVMEERGVVEGTDKTNRWIVDPLDGTTNFLHGFPTFSVSIALRKRDVLEVGVVYDPCRQELYTTMRGRGAQLDGKRIRVSERRELEGTLIGTGFPYRANTRWMKTYLGMLGSVMENTAGVRRPGSAALDLCYLAAGRLDGFFEFGLEIWDVAAGTLMIQEAGGVVSSLTGNGSHLDSGNVLAGNLKIHDALRELFTPHLNADSGPA
ncbi:MAG: inositol monophosphatase [Hyphomonadaceae bacterium]|nr:inositol monophosphatase [Hyphomonadaceae bacterium]